MLLILYNIILYYSIILCFQNHNKYLASKKRLVENEDAKEFHKVVMDRLNELREEDLKEIRVVFSWK
jgi:hypothetical protein